MGRRFGRNQKRLMRLEIAAGISRVNQLEQALKMDRGLISHLSAKAESAREYAELVASIVGENSIAAGEPKNLNFKYAGRDRVLIDVPERNYSSPDCNLDEVRFETLRVLEVKTVRDQTARQMHVRVNFADEIVGYAMSEQALMNMPEDRLVSRLSIEIARQLVKQIRGK